MWSDGGDGVMMVVMVPVLSRQAGRTALVAQSAQYWARQRSANISADGSEILNIQIYGK